MIGLAFAFAGGRLIRGLLFEVQPSDMVTYAGVAVGLLGTALVASYVPARRASRIDPIKALRTE
jgi:ABC-type lipoprotein release transport system permease subunit